MIAYFNRFAIELTSDQAHAGSHQGQCDSDIADLRLDRAVDKELSRLPADDVRDELREYGAWEDDELADHEANLNRILWLACGQITEELAN